MYGCESWTIKKAEHRRTDAFKLQYWTRLLIVTERRSNQSILKDINPEYSLEGLMLKLKLQYSGHLMQRADSLEKTLMMGKIEGRREVDNRGRDDRMASPTQWACLSKLWEMVKDREAWRAAVHGSQGVGHNLVTKQQQGTRHDTNGRQQNSRDTFLQCFTQFFMQKHHTQSLKANQIRTRICATHTHIHINIYILLKLNIV